MFIDCKWVDTRCLKHFYEEFSKILSQMYKRLHVKCPSFLLDCNENRTFSRDIRKPLKISNFMKFRPLGVKFHSDGQADMTKPIFKRA